MIIALAIAFASLLCEATLGVAEVEMLDTSEPIAARLRQRQNSSLARIVGQPLDKTSLLKPGWGCLPHEGCSWGECCALGSSCNSCPRGYDEDDSYCWGKGNYRCRSAKVEAQSSFAPVVLIAFLLVVLIAFLLILSCVGCPLCSVRERPRLGTVTPLLEQSRAMDGEDRIIVFSGREQLSTGDADRDCEMHDGQSESENSWTHIRKPSEIPEADQAWDTDGFSESDACTDVSMTSWASVSPSQCFLPGASFLNSTGGEVLVSELQCGHVLRGSEGDVEVIGIKEHAGVQRKIVDIVTEQFILSVTDDHRIIVATRSGPMPMAAGDLRKGKLCSSNGELSFKTKVRRKETLVYEVSFSGDRSVYARMSHPLAVVRGSAAVPYNDADYVQFNFKGQVCEHLRLVGTRQWLLDKGLDVEGLGLQFWESSPFGIWGPTASADEIYIRIDEILVASGLLRSKIYRRISQSWNPETVYPPTPGNVTP